MTIHLGTPFPIGCVTIRPWKCSHYTSGRPYSDSPSSTDITGYFPIHNLCWPTCIGLAHILKLISSIPAFCLKTSYFINKNSPGGNFASGAVLLTIAFKVSAFHFIGQNLTDVPIWSTCISSNL